MGREDRSSRPSPTHEYIGFVALLLLSLFVRRRHFACARAAVNGEKTSTSSGGLSLLRDAELVRDTRPRENPTELHREPGTGLLSGLAQAVVQEKEAAVAKAVPSQAQAVTVAQAQQRVSSLPSERYQQEPGNAPDVATGRFGRARDLDDLAALQAVVPRDGVVQLNSRELGVLQAAVHESIGTGSILESEANEDGAQDPGREGTYYRVKRVFLSSGESTSCLGTRTCCVMLTSSSDSWNASIVNCCAMAVMTCERAEPVQSTPAHQDGGEGGRRTLFAEGVMLVL